MTSAIILSPITIAIIVLLQAMPFPGLQQDIQKGSIEGIVVRLGTGEPLAGVQMTLTAVQVGAASSATGPMLVISGSGFSDPRPVTVTDRDGKFIFKDLDPGSYSITAARNGYVKQDYGQKLSPGPGAVNLASGQALKDLIFRLSPASTISGQVRDSGGEPVTGMWIQLLRLGYNGGGKQSFAVVASARSDDRGQYRLYWVTPGRYYLNAGIGNPDQRPAGSSTNEVSPKPYLTTWHPGTLDPSQAATIEVQPGAELDAIDFVLAEQQRYRITGSVIDGRTGQPPRGVEISITPRQRDVSFGFSVANRTYSPANGKFEFRNVAEGSYWVHATIVPLFDTAIAPRTPTNTFGELFQSVLSSRPAAQVAVDVSGADVENVSLTLSPGVSIHGRLTVEGDELSKIEGFREIQVMLQATTPDHYFPLPRPMPPDGTFVLDNVSFGEYRLTVTRPQPDVYIKEARLDSSDVLGQPLVVTNANPGTLEIVLSSKGGQIDGLVVNDQSEPVSGMQAVLIPDLAGERADLYKSAVSDPNGRFTLRGIPPGQYKLFAWESIEPFAYFDPDFIRQFQQKGHSVSISESSKIAAEVKVIPTR